MPKRKTAQLDLMHPGDRDTDADAVRRSLALGAMGWARGISPRVLPDDRLADAEPYAPLRIRVLQSPPVAAQRAQHLAAGTVVLAYPDDEVPPYTVTLFRPVREVPVRQYAVRVPTPDGDVRLWPEEFEIVEEEG
jgi:hypothetical protein